jgi:hypothetical protein
MDKSCFDEAPVEFSVMSHYVIRSEQHFSHSHESIAYRYPFNRSLCRDAIDTFSRVFVGPNQFCMGSNAASVFYVPEYGPNLDNRVTLTIEPCCFNVND